MIRNDDILELKLENNVQYKIYIPYKDSDYIQKHIFNTKKPYEYEMLLHILTQISKGSTILDIGMNIANHSLFLAANGFKIHAFEANAKMSAIAKRSIALNSFEKRIKVYEFGVSDKEEKAYFANENPHNFGAMSLSMLDENLPQKDYILCKSIDSLDIKDEVALIKLDIEGMEAKALKGMQKLIAKNRPIIYVEANYVHDFFAIDRVLNEYDYVHWDIFGSSPMHLYYPNERLSESRKMSKCISNAAAGRFLFENYIQNGVLYACFRELQTLRLELSELKNKIQ